jgi:hypothetical protein
MANSVFGFFLIAEMLQCDSFEIHSPPICYPACGVFCPIRSESRLMARISLPVGLPSPRQQGLPQLGLRRKL